MAVTIDIFNPQVSVVAEGMAGKTILIYGGNNVGKTFVASRLSKPYFIAAESGLNAQSGVKYNRIKSWTDFKNIVRQFTNKATVDKARELYDTIVIDEVYATSIMCQDYVIATFGDGALTLADGDSRHNLYSLYEKEYFKMINLLLSCDYTVVFIGHAQEKDGYFSPKGDKRCINPIVDNCDFVVYVRSNGVDAEGNLIKSSGYLVETKQFFARSRFEHCPPVIEEFTAENLESTIAQAVKNEAKFNNATIVDYDTQKAMNTVETEEYEAVYADVQLLGKAFIEKGMDKMLTMIIEDTLGKGRKVSDCNERQIEALITIRNDLRAKSAEIGL